MSPPEPARCTVALPEGRLVGPGTHRYTKRFADLPGLYADTAAFQAMLPALAETIVYEVTDLRPSERPGDMITGVTRMSPGRVGREFFLTRGHIHAQADRPEIYYGQQGHGLMLLENPQGETRVVEIGPQTLCYVPPFWIHRSVNTGPDDLVMLFSYPADSGQDYDIIARSGGMRSRILDNGAGGWVEVPNPDWRPRPAEVIARLLTAAAGPQRASALEAR
jgi:glucose-6-phosphate isomerase